jgi:hypothetical protein
MRRPVTGTLMTDANVPNRDAHGALGT